VEFITLSKPPGFPQVGVHGAEEAAEGASRLIGANRARIDPRKLTDYALNPNHPVGGNKAKVFDSALGYNQSNSEGLLQQLQRGVMQNTPVPGKVDSFGARFTVDIPVTGPSGSATVRTGWILKPGSTTPEMTTLFVK
jgi:filamentous hemagglutinin